MPEDVAVSQSVRDLLRRLLVVDANERLTLSQVRATFVLKASRASLRCVAWKGHLDLMALEPWGVVSPSTQICLCQSPK